MTSCKKCKKEIPNGALYCPWCGAAQKRNPKKKMYQRPDGLYEQIKTINGKRVAFRGKTEKEVTDKMIAYQEKEEAGPLFRTVAENCREEHFEQVAVQTHRCYASGYKDLIERFGDKHVKEITQADINRWIDELKRKGYASKTIRNRLTVARIIYKHLCSGKYGEIDYDPTRHITLPRGLPKARREAASSSDITTILSHPDGYAGLLMAFLLLTGMRLGEAQAIQGADINREARKIWVRKAVYYDHNLPKIKEPKTEAGVRAVPLPDRLERLLPRLKKEQYLFADENGELMHFTRVRRAINKYRETYQIEATPHQLRHAYATLMHDADLSAKDAQYILGHSSISVTEDIYTHISQARQDENLARINAYLDSLQ